MCLTELQGPMSCRVPRHYCHYHRMVPTGREPSQGDKMDGEGHDRDGDSHGEAVNGHNASQVYTASYN
jgi:hypothetical protein